MPDAKNLTVVHDEAIANIVPSVHPKVINLGGQEILDQAALGLAVSQFGNQNFVNLDLGGAAGGINRWTQFTVDNTGEGSRDCKLRIGSRLGMQGAYARFGVEAGAADNGVIRDQFGIGCLAVQGFSELTQDRAMLITTLRLKSTDSNQISTPISQGFIGTDLKVVYKDINTLATEQKSDERTDLMDLNGNGFILSSDKFFEFVVYSGKQVIVLLYVEAIDNIGQMVKPS